MSDHDDDADGAGRPEYRIQLVGPELWEERVCDCSPAARSLLQTLHDRQLGITPTLAASLAAALNSRPGAPYLGREDDPWMIAGEQLRQAQRVQRSAEVAGDSRGGRDLFFSAAPSYFVFRVAAFLLHRACCRLGHTVLFCADRQRWGVSPADYGRYAEELRRSLLDVVHDEAGELDLFWHEAAAAISGRARRLTGRAPDTSILPQADAVALAFLHRLQLWLADEKLDPRPVRRAEQARPQRTLRRHRRIAGIHGITVSRSQEDVNDMLLSELVLPQPYRLQRLLNEGFLARFRPPKRQQNRDLLLALLIPGELRDTLPGAFLKACWYELCVRLGHRLCQSGLLRSEFRLIEGQRLGLVRSEVFSLSALSSPQLATRDKPSEYFRHDFLHSLQWLPRFVDPQGPWSEPAPQRGLGAGPPPAGILDWFAAAWRSQGAAAEEIVAAPRLGGRQAAGAGSGRRGRGGSGGRRPPRDRGPRGGVKWSIGDFKFVHLMTACPERLRRETSAVSQHLLGKRLLRGAPPEARLSVTWLPDTLEAEGWAFEAGRGRVVPTAESTGSVLGGGLFRSPQQEAAVYDMAALARALVGAWFRQIQQEIWQG